MNLVNKNMNATNRIIMVAILSGTLAFVWMVTAMLIGTIHGHYFKDGLVDYQTNKELWMEQSKICLEKGGVPKRSGWDGEISDCLFYGETR